MHHPQSPFEQHRDNNVIGGDGSSFEMIWDAETVVIPLPRKSPENSDLPFPETPGDDGGWRYHYRAKRGPGWMFTAHAQYISGGDGDRLRAELAAVIRDLLDWAASQSGTDQDKDDRKSA